MPRFEYERDGDNIVRHINTDRQTITESPFKPYSRLLVATDDGRLANNGTDAETVAVTVRDGLKIARGTEITDTSILDHNGDVTVLIDGEAVTKTLTGGSVSFELTTEKAAGETIEIVAESLADVPAESDSAEIEVIQA